MHGPGTVRSGSWKFYPWKETNNGRNAIKDRVVSTDPVQLYHVVDDIGERKNVAADHPDVVAKLQAAYDAHVAEIRSNLRPTLVMRRPPSPVSSPSLPSRNTGKPSKEIDWSKVKIGDVYTRSNSPNVANRAFSVSALVEGDELSGIVAAQGGEVVGYSLYVKGAECVFAVRLSNNVIHRVKAPIASGKSTIKAGIDVKGTLSLQINDKDIASAPGGLIGRHPAESFCIGHDDKMLVDQEAATTPFTGKLINLKVE
jgi:hypothetical protein